MSLVIIVISINYYYCSFIVLSLLLLLIEFLASLSFSGFIVFISVSPSSSFLIFIAEYLIV